MSRRGLGGLVGHITLRGYDAAEVSRDTATVGGGPSQVQQHFAEEVDINTIMRRFGVTRQLPSGQEGGFYGDFTGISDYQSALEAVQRAQDGFMALPAEVREKFRNDPGMYLDHVDSLTDEELASDLKPAVVVPPAQPAAAAPSSPAPAAPPR